MATTVRVAAQQRLPVDEQLTRYLRKARENIFDQGNTPVSVRILAQDLHLSQQAVYRACRDLARRGIIEEINASGPYPYYRL